MNIINSYKIYAFIWSMVIGFCVGSSDVQAQDPYQFNVKNDAPLLGLSAIGLGTYFKLNKQDEGLSESDILKLDKDQLWTINAWSVGQSSPGARKISDIALRSSFLLPLTLLAGENSRNNFGSVGILTLETLLLNTALTNVSKVTAGRKRPYLYRNDYQLYEWESKNAHWSFYSGHTSTVAAMSFTTAQMYVDFYPDSSFKPLAWTTAAVIPALTGYLRMKGGRHFFTDVLVGYLAGAAVGILVPKLH